MTNKGKIEVKFTVYVEETDDLQFDSDYVSDMISNVVMGNFPAETIVEDYTLYVSCKETE